MPTRPRVSVVVPTFNNAEFIEDTIDSVLNQTFKDFELLVADHDSEDDTWALLQKYQVDPRVRLFRTPAGGGAARNWNRVTDLAQGELLKLVCGDDLVRVDSLARQVDAYDKASTGVAMVASPRDVINDRGRVLIAGRGLGGLRGRVPGARAIRRSVRSGTNIFGEPCCVLINRSLLQQAGGWDGTHGYFIDLSTYARLLAKGDLIALPETLAAFRVSAGQWSVRLAAEQARQARLAFRQMYEDTPHEVSQWDFWQGKARARCLVIARRIVYATLRPRRSS
jgi:glycosyltransferase involved in cell wall biosynthesis